jgi:hypothetical protein
LVLIATPVDLRRLMGFAKPALRVRYEAQEIGEPTLAQVLERLREAITARPQHECRFTPRSTSRQGSRPTLYAARRGFSGGVL